MSYHAPMVQERIEISVGQLSFSKWFPIQDIFSALYFGAHDLRLTALRLPMNQKPAPSRVAFCNGEAVAI